MFQCLDGGKKLAESTHSRFFITKSMGINIYKLLNEQNWDKKKSKMALTNLLKEWESFLESGLLIKRGNRFFLSDPKGMELSNQILVSMFRWWEKFN